MHASVVIHYLLAKEKAFDPRFFLLHQKETITLFNMYDSSLGSQDAFSPITPLVPGYIHLNSRKTFALLSGDHEFESRWCQDL